MTIVWTLSAMTSYGYFITKMVAIIVRLCTENDKGSFIVNLIDEISKYLL